VINKVIAFPKKSSVKLDPAAVMSELEIPPDGWVWFPKTWTLTRIDEITPKYLREAA